MRFASTTQRLRRRLASGVLVTGLALSAGLASNMPSAHASTNPVGSVGTARIFDNDHVKCFVDPWYDIRSVTSPNLNVSPSSAYRNSTQIADVYTILQYWNGRNWAEYSGVYARRSVRFYPNQVTPQFVRSAGFDVDAGVFYRIRDFVSWSVNGRQVGYTNNYYSQTQFTSSGNADIGQTGFGDSWCRLLQ